MQRDQTPSGSGQGDDRLEQVLDRLAALAAPESAAGPDFVAGVMQRLRGTDVAVRRPGFRSRWPIRLAIGTAACLAIALALWRSTAAHRPPRVVAATGDEKQIEAGSKEAGNNPTPAPLPTAALPKVRTSTWSDVTETVVLEHDVPVRKLLYREFERVELLDPQGNPESRLIVPTKAMLVATKEQY